LKGHVPSQRFCIVESEIGSVQRPEVWEIACTYSGSRWIRFWPIKPQTWQHNNGCAVVMPCMLLFRCGLEAL